MGTATRSALSEDEYFQSQEARDLDRLFELLEEYEGELDKLRPRSKLDEEEEKKYEGLLDDIAYIEELYIDLHHEREEAELKR